MIQVGSLRSERRCADTPTILLGAPLEITVFERLPQNGAVRVYLGELSEYGRLQFVAAQTVLIARRPAVAQPRCAGVVLVALRAAVGGGADQRPATAIADQAQAVSVRIVRGLAISAD